MAELETAPANLSELGRLQRLGRKLDSWEVLLESHSRSPGLSEKDLQRRRKRLEDLRQRWEVLRLRLESSSLNETEGSVQLPPLDLCSPEERVLCEQYLDAQYKISEQLRLQLEKVLRWVDQAAQGQKPGWRAKVRLAKIRRFLLELDEERQRLDPHRARQSHHWEKLADRLLLYRDPHAEVADTRLAFEKVVRLTNQVASLQNQIHELQHKTQRMEQWLKQAHKRLRSQRAPSPPLAEDLRLITHKIDLLGLEDLNRSKSRIALARRYLEKFLDKEAPIDEEDEL